MDPALGRSLRKAHLYKAKLERVDRERKHLESLLKDRINFYLVFAGLFLGGIHQLDERIRQIALAAGTLVSILLCLAIIRTFRLVKLALEDIERIDYTHPYIKYRDDICFPPNANNLLVLIPILLTGLFGVVTWLAL